MPTIDQSQPYPEANSVAVIAAALAAVTVWAATPVVTKLAVADLEPLAVGLLRTLFAAVAALPLLLAGRVRLPRSSKGRGLLLLATLGGYVGFPILFSLGVGRTSAGHGALLLGLLPVLTGLVAALFERRLPGRRWWLGAAVALAGCVLLVDQRFGLAAPGVSLEGDLLVILSCVFASTGYVAGALAGREAGSWAVTLWGALLGGLAVMPLMPFASAVKPLLQAPADLWLALIYLSLLSSLLAYAAWYWALGRGGVSRTGLLQFAQPILGLLFAGVLLGEALTWPLSAAAAVIVAGMALARRAPAK